MQRLFHSLHYTIQCNIRLMNGWQNAVRGENTNENNEQLITGRICRRQLCRYFVYSRADFGVFRPAGATRCTDQGQSSSLPNLTLIGSGVGVYGPQN